MKRVIFILSTSITVILVLLTGLFVLLRITGLVAIYNVPTQAMATFINKGDQIAAEGLSIMNRLPSRGDVVAFTTAGLKQGYMPPEPQMYIKRVVGLPGDRLEFKDGILHINGRPVSEYFDITGIHYVPLMLLKNDSFTVPADHLFVMGDNSANSSDSRFWGALPVKNLRQKYWFHLMRAPSPEIKQP